MVKHTQTIHRQKPTNCLSVFDRFAGLVFKGLTAGRKGRVSEFQELNVSVIVSYGT